MPELSIRIKKKNDGSAALSCTRADGTTTWQRQNGPQGAFFPLHDLTHLAVESVLGLRRAFYGLLTEGRDISSFERTDERGALPHEALFAELIVGYFDLERRVGEHFPVAEFNDKARAYFADHGAPEPPFELTQAQIDAVRARRATYFAQWSALAPGDALELSFDRSTQTGACVVG
ncbi:MAG TPA: hypothetical protein VGM67_05140 [Gemmatimonadaceae bacterium]|jgi:hypothetical protein